MPRIEFKVRFGFLMEGGLLVFSARFASLEARKHCCTLAALYAANRVFHCKLEVSNTNKIRENRCVRIGQVELANRRLQPLGHLSSRTCGVAIVAVWGVLWGSWLKHLQLAEPFGLCSRVPASDETPFFCSYPGLGIRWAPSKRVGH